MFVVVVLATGCSTPGAVHAPTVASGAVSSSSTVTTTPATAPAATPLPAGAAPCGVRSVAPVRYDHVVWIWMENRTYGDVLGNAAAPYETALARQCATDRAYHQVGSPSLPNYLGATSGQTYGIADDAGPAAHPITADNLFRQVRNAGGTERSYIETMPADCATVPQGTYAVKHNPAAYYIGGLDRGACLADDVPLGTPTGGSLLADVDGGRLPTFALVVPNLCDDGHNCPAASGDRWLATWLPRILDGPEYRAGSTAVFVVWDESTPMPNIVISPTTPPGLVSSATIDHYALLRTTEELLGLPLLGRAGASPSLRPLFRL